MRINVYSQELTDEVIKSAKRSNTGRTYRCMQLILHSSDKLHHPTLDDDRSGKYRFGGSGAQGQTFENGLSF